MKKIMYSLLVLLFILGFLTSCLTKLPPKESDKDALLVIAVEKQIDKGLRVGVDTYIELTIKNREKPIKIRKDKPYIVISDLPRGIYETQDIRLVAKAAPGSNTVTDERKRKPIKFEIPMTLKSGHIFIFPIKFVFMYYQKAGQNYYGWDYSKITDIEMKSIIKELSEYDNFSQWEHDY